MEFKILRKPQNLTILGSGKGQALLIRGSLKDKAIASLKENKSSLTDGQALGALKQVLVMEPDREEWYLPFPVVVDGVLVLLTDKFDGQDNYGKPKVDYLKNMLAMTDEKLEDETRSKIWLSAYASNNPRSDYHWHVDACYDEWQRRGKVNKYGDLHDQVLKENGG